MKSIIIGPGRKKIAWLIGSNKLVDQAVVIHLGDPPDQRLAKPVFHKCILFLGDKPSLERLQVARAAKSECIDQLIQVETHASRSGSDRQPGFLEIKNFSISLPVEHGVKFVVACPGPDFRQGVDKHLDGNIERKWIGNVFDCKFPGGFVQVAKPDRIGFPGLQAIMAVLIGYRSASGAGHDGDGLNRDHPEAVIDRSSEFYLPVSLLERQEEQ